MAFEFRNNQPSSLKDGQKLKKGQRDVVVVSEEAYAKLMGGKSVTSDLEPLPFDPSDRDRIAAARAQGLSDDAPWSEIYEKTKESPDTKM